MMMQIAALFVILLAGLWLIGVAVLMATRPDRFRHYLSRTAATWRINLTEQGLRLFAGIALVVRAEASKLPLLLEAGGWFIILSSVALLVIPLHLHAGYAIFWSRKLKPWMVRAIAPLSAAFGLGLIAAAL